jgi:hypothetical protein
MSAISQLLRLRVLLVAGLIAVTSFSTAIAASNFTTIDVSGAGTGAMQGTVVIGIDTAGDVAGGWLDSNGLSHGFVRSASGTITKFDVTSGGSCVAATKGTTPTGMDTAGNIVGMSRDANLVYHGFVRAASTGTITCFDVTGAGTNQWSTSEGTKPFGINATAGIVGFYVDANIGFHGFVRATNGTITNPLNAPDAGTSDLQGTQVFGINDTGEIAGIYYDSNTKPHGFVRSTSGSYTEFNAPGVGNCRNSAQGRTLGVTEWSIDAAGDVAGSYYDTNCVQHGFLRTANGTFTTLDAPGASTSPCPQSTNGAASTICGTFALKFDATGDITGGYADSNYVVHGFVRPAETGIITSFDDPIAGNTGSNINPLFGGTASIPGTLGSSLISNANGITIVGAYSDTNNVLHGFIFTPALTSTTTTLTPAPTPNPSIFGEPVTLTAAVTSTAGAPPNGENVSFLSGTTTLGAGTLSGGVASLTTTALTTATDWITAVYGGGADLAGSTSTAVSQVVGKASSSTTLKSSLNPSTYGQSVTLTASVSGQFGGTVTGTVTFSNGSTSLGSVSLSGNSAGLTTTALPSGTDSITAVYSGDTNFTGSTSNSVSQLVGANGSPVLSISPNSLNFGVVTAQGRSFSSAPPQTITVTNTGTANLSISTITIGGTNPGDFATSSDTCSGTSVAPKSACTVAVIFTPATTASRLATLTVNSNAGASQTVNIAGTGMYGFHQCGGTIDPQDVPLYFDNASTDTCSEGCALTSLGNALSTFAPTSTPTNLDNFLSTPDKYLPAGSGNMNFCAIPDFLGGSVQWFDGRSFTSQADLNSFLTNEIVTDSRVAILELCETSSNVCHYVSVTGQGTGKNAGDWVMFDPGWANAYDSISDCKNGATDNALLTSLNAHLNGITVNGTSSGCKTYYFSANAGGALGAAISKNAQCIHALSPVELLITDPSGNQIGSTGQGSDIHGIASASYFREYPILDAQGSSASLGEATGIKAAYIPSAVNGTYSLTATGTGFGPFTLQFHTLASDGSAQDATVSGLASTGSTATYQVSYSTSPGVPPVITRVATGPSVAVSSNSLLFGGQLIGTTSSPITLSLGNTGGTTLQTLGLSVSSGFAQSSNCTSSLTVNGTCTISVTFSPSAVGQSTGTLTISSNASGSPLNVTLTGTGTAPVTTTPTVTVTPSASSITTAQALSVTVAVSGGAGKATATGSVILSGGGYTSTATTLNSGSATINIPAGSLATGADTLTASYTPDSSSSSTYNTATGSNSVTVTTPVSASFTVSGTAVTVAKGATTANTSTITVTPAGGFTGSVALTAAVTSSPTGAQYLPTLSFGSTTPVGITGTTAGTATLTITTTAATSAVLVHPKSPGVPWYAAGGATLACLLLFGIPARRRRWQTLLGSVVLLVALAGGVLACGGGGGSTGGGGGTGNPGTTAGSYTITITGTSGSTTATGTVALTVQ